jgi:outer membrane protein TolC
MNTARVFRITTRPVGVVVTAWMLAAILMAGPRASAQTNTPATPDTNLPFVATDSEPAGAPAEPSNAVAAAMDNMQTNTPGRVPKGNYQLFGFKPLSPEAESNAIAEATNATIQATDQTNAVKKLSLEECVARALTNNFDVKIQRLNPSIQNWGVVIAQGEYDPTLSGSASYENSLIPEPGNIPTIREETSPSLLSLGGRLASGATYDLSSSSTRFTAAPTVSPAFPIISTNFTYTGTTSLQVSQPLLKNFGFDVNTAVIRIARKSRDIAVQNFLLQMITSISAVDNAYYELVFAIEDYKAKREDLGLAQSLLDQTRIQLRIGTASPLDVVTSEAGVAERLQAVILAARTIKDNENALKLVISQNVQEFRGESLVPVDYPDVRPVETDVDHSISTALQLRPDYVAALQTVERQNIQVKFNHNQLWPEIDLSGSYGWNGGANNFGDLVSSEATRNYSVWSAGVSVTFPLGNRAARGTYNQSRLQADQLLLQLKQLEQQTIVNVDNAVGHVRTNYESVQAARAATRLAYESYEAEKTKLQAGTSTPVLVLQQESALADARSAQIRAEASYSESLVALAQAEGTTLQRHHIQLNESF